MLKTLRLSLSVRKSCPRYVQSNVSRTLLTLAIESSCDDTSVAILEKESKNEATTARLHFHQKITSNNLAYKGVHPIVALESHEQNLALLVQEALKSLPRVKDDVKNYPNAGIQLDNTLRQKPDFVTVTRGPGMRSNLSTGLNTAKGLAVAWQIPLLAVNHMQAHALTPRLVTASQNDSQSDKAVSTLKPEFPFLSLLVSGGHTMLIRSESLISHPTIASTVDIAIGDCIDKIARNVLSQDVLAGAKSAMYGPVLEKFAFPSGTSDYNYTAPASRAEEIASRPSSWGWSITSPFVETKALKYSFVGVESTVRRIVESKTEDMTIDERKDLARSALRVAFEHLASRVVLALNEMTKPDPKSARAIQTLVVSGGVAANQYLRCVLRGYLDARGYDYIGLVFPPLELCTDNAAMVAWAGMEMYEAGYMSDLSCQALRKWSLDPNAADGGILGVPGWKSTQHSS